MNRVVVSQTAAGLASYLLDSGLAGGRLGRSSTPGNSDVFARDTAEIMAGAGLKPGSPTACCPPWWPLASALLLRAGSRRRTIITRQRLQGVPRGRVPDRAARRRRHRVTDRRDFPASARRGTPVDDYPDVATSSLPLVSRGVLGAGGRSPGSELDLYAAAWSRCSGRRAGGCCQRLPCQRRR